MADTEHSESIPQAVEHPTMVSEDGSSAELGFTESDPVGPPHEDGDSKGLLAGKYKTPEELEKAYKELEAKLGGKPAQEQAKAPDTPKVAAVETTEEATAMLRDKGLDIATFTSEYERTGQLSPESYTSLEKAGIGREMVDQYINGQRVLVAAQEAEVKNSVGGEDEYTKLIAWARVNLNDSEKQAYDRIIATNDLTAIKMAAQGIKSRYDGAMGKDPTVVVGGRPAGGNDGLERFESRAQMVEAMKDKRYETDPAYRAKVERKVLNSSI